MAEERKTLGLLLSRAAWRLRLAAVPRAPKVRPGVSWNAAIKREETHTHKQSTQQNKNWSGGCKECGGDVV